MLNYKNIYCSDSKPLSAHFATLWQPVSIGGGSQSTQRNTTYFRQENGQFYNFTRAHLVTSLFRKHDLIVVKLVFTVQKLQRFDQRLPHKSELLEIGEQV